MWDGADRATWHKLQLKFSSLKNGCHHSSAMTLAHPLLRLAQQAFLQLGISSILKLLPFEDSERLPVREQVSRGGQKINWLHESSCGSTSGADYGQTVCCEEAQKDCVGSFINSCGCGRPGHRPGVLVMATSDREYLQQRLKSLAAFYITTVTNCALLNSEGRGSSSASR